MVEALFLSGVRVDEEAHDHRRTAHVGDLMRGDRLVDARGLDLSQADMRSRDGRERPGEAPAIAVEHGHGPQIGRVLRHPRRHHIPHGEQIRAAMVIDDALGIACRAAGVVQADRVPFVGGRLPGEVRVAGLQEGLIGDRADLLALGVGLGVLDADDERLCLAELQRGVDETAELPVGDHDLCLAMVEDEGDFLRAQAIV